MSDPDALWQGMVDRLIKAEELAPGWRPAFQAVPRHAFIPDLIWRHDPSIKGPNDLAPVRRSEDPATWLELTCTDDAVITQVDDGSPAGPGLRGRLPTSSASMPLLVSRMLRPRDGFHDLTLRYDPAFRDTHEVRQSGPRRLWDEVEAAYHWWVDQGSPAADRWWFEVGPDGQRVTLRGGEALSG